MVVFDPIKVVITNYPEDLTEEMEIENNSMNEEMGYRKVPFSRELYIDREDFMEVPVKNTSVCIPETKYALKEPIL